MIIKRLRIENFKIFYGTQEIEFKAPSPLFILIAPNGFGKSTILDAISFVLYGGPWRSTAFEHEPDSKHDYLNYHARSEVLDLNYAEEKDMDALTARAGNVYVLNDVFEYLPSLRVRFPVPAKKVDAYAAMLRPDAVKVTDDEFGGVWELRRDRD